MKTRIITAIIALAVFIPLILIGKLPLTIFALILALIGMSELIAMKKLYMVSFAAAVSFIGTIIVAMPDKWVAWMPDQLGRTTLIYIVAMLLLAHTVFHKQRFNFEDAAVLVLGMLYIGFGFNALVIARSVSFETLLYGMLVVWLTDSFAYFCGRMFGKHKLAPKVSPNKTWEGSLGGTIVATLVLAIYLHFFPVGYANQGLMIAMTFVLSVLGQIGDLIESAFKRYYGVKDSGKLLPGHGGILDRFDSMLVVLPAMYILGML
ncbi:MAG: phosphatidate cytidylyltransferase [Limosilactobacillus sp.]|nr:phosphatidate cytidylyltransferase [Limosilactobacillus sp.]